MIAAICFSLSCQTTQSPQHFLTLQVTKSRTFEFDMSVRKYIQQKRDKIHTHIITTYAETKIDSITETSGTTNNLFLIVA